MESFPSLIRKIRVKSGLTQTEFARLLDVSPILIAMVETGQKDVSKSLVEKIARILDVQPASISPFLFTHKISSIKDLSFIEQQLYKYGTKLQEQLIEQKAKLLRSRIEEER